MENPITIDRLVRSRRRTLGLTVTRDAHLVVHAPKWLTLREIERFIGQKAGWIRQKQELFRQNPRPQVKELTVEERQTFRAHVVTRVEYYANLAGLQYKSVKLSHARTRWGSCGPNDNLNFSWRLINTPARVVDYLIVHELMHLKQRNHSKKFWDEVRNMIPDYKTDEIWLKKNGSRVPYIQNS